MDRSSRRLRLSVAVVAVALAIGLVGTRAVQMRRQARIHAYYARMFQQQAARHGDSARDCEAFGGDSMLQVAQAYREQSNAELRRSDYHAKLSRAYGSAVFQPWVIPPPDPAAPAVP